MATLSIFAIGIAVNGLVVNPPTARPDRHSRTGRDLQPRPSRFPEPNDPEVQGLGFEDRHVSERVTNPFRALRGRQNTLDGAE